MLPLEIGALGTLQARCVTIPHFNDGRETTILYASDLHLGIGTPHIVHQMVETVARIRPDVVLLGGDMLDTKVAFPQLGDLLNQLQRVCPVWAISGNHDCMVGLEVVKSCIESSGGGWLDDQSLLLRGGSIQIDGFIRAHAAPFVFSILCAHDPAIYPEAVQSGYDLVLAGHLHGSQCVLGEYRGRLYPGAWFFRWNGNEFQQGETRMIVSRGVNDTLPIRWNCPREVIVCRIR